MLTSMTGFATTTITVTNQQGESSHITITLKTVNARFFEVSCRMPYQFNHLEMDISKKLKDALFRGHAYLNINISNPALFHGGVHANLPIAQSYLNALGAIKENFSVKGDITINDITQYKEIFSVQETALAEDPKIITPLMAAVDATIVALANVRAQEGVNLYQDIAQRLENMNHEISVIAQKATELMEQKKVYVAQELANLEADKSDVAQSRKAQLHNELDKADIHEELIRFASHMKELAAFIANSVAEKGRRVDFILQELSREINTIASKCSDATVSTRAINIKVELEKTREQTQNIV